MKKYLLLVILVLGFINFGCEKCEECEVCEECNPDEYYIKYAVGLDTKYMGVELDITYINDKNETIPLATSDGWSLTIGPVDEDFNASILAATKRKISNTTLKVNIQVSKNNGPFVIKASDENDTSEPLQIEYTIDF